MLIMWPIHLSSHHNAVERKYRSEPKRRSRLQRGISIPSFISIGQIMQYYTVLTGVLRNDAHANKIARTHKNRQIYRSLWLLHFGEPLSCPRYPISKKPNPRTQLKRYRLALTGAQGVAFCLPNFLLLLAQWRWWHDDGFASFANQYTTIRALICKAKW